MNNQWKTVPLSKVLTCEQFGHVKKILKDKTLSDKEAVDNVVSYLRPDEERINNLGLDLRFLAYNLQYQLTKQYFDTLKRLQNS